MSSFYRNFQFKKINPLALFFILFLVLMVPLTLFGVNQIQTLNQRASTGLPIVGVVTLPPRPLSITPTSVLVRPTCIVPPPCLTTPPFCYPPVPVGGWCPTITPHPTQPILPPSPFPSKIPSPMPTNIPSPTPTPPPGCQYKQICTMIACPITNPTCNCHSVLVCPTNIPTVLPSPTPIQSPPALPTNTPLPTSITFSPADVNRDGCINILDFNDWLQAFTGNPVPNTYPDIDGDGTVDIVDFNIWLTTFSSIYNANPNDPRLCTR